MAEAQGEWDFKIEPHGNLKARTLDGILNSPRDQLFHLTLYPSSRIARVHAAEELYDPSALRTKTEIGDTNLRYSRKQGNLGLEDPIHITASGYDIKSQGAYIFHINEVHVSDSDLARVHVSASELAHVASLLKQELVTRLNRKPEQIFLQYHRPGGVHRIQSSLAELIKKAEKGELR